jgi:hypothetical protein
VVLDWRTGNHSVQRLENLNQGLQTRLFGSSQLSKGQTRQVLQAKITHILADDSLLQPHDARIIPRTEMGSLLRQDIS